jgi:FkbM family methyltransferase
MVSSAPPVWVRMWAPVVRRLPAGRYRLMNWLCRRPVAPFWARTPRHLGGCAFCCDLRDSIAREVCFTGRYEPQETALLLRLLGPGATFVDVGANWGYFSLLGASLVGPGGRVVSLEPDPRLFALLEANVRRNDLQQVTACQVAAADTAGTLRLAGFDEAGGNWGLSRLAGGDGATHFEVAARPIDELLDEQNVDRVDLLKMDIEGAEDLALRGMREGLRRGRYRRVLLEVHPTLLAERGRSVSEVLGLLRDAGYRGWHVDHSPAATRQAAYRASLDASRFLLPLKDGEIGDAWPHLLWLSPEVRNVLD